MDQSFFDMTSTEIAILVVGSLVIPFITAMATKVRLDGAWKGVVSVVQNGIVAGLMFLVENEVAFSWETWIGYTLTSLLITAGSYYQFLFKPAEALNQKTSEIGIGPSQKAVAEKVTNGTF